MHRFLEGRFLLFFSAFKALERRLQILVVLLLLGLCFVKLRDFDEVGDLAEPVITDGLALINDELVTNTEVIAILEATEQFGLVEECVFEGRVK